MAVIGFFDINVPKPLQLFAGFPIRGADKPLFPLSQ
jgi:hypothetical protein